jgi:hypothetical protein
MLVLDAQPFSTPHTEPSVKGLVGQLCGYFEVAGASGRIRPEALFGQKAPWVFDTSSPAAFLIDTSMKPGSPEKSFTSPAGSAFVFVLVPSRSICWATTGSLYDFRVTLNSRGASSTETYVPRSRKTPAAPSHS